MKPHQIKQPKRSKKQDKKELQHKTSFFSVASSMVGHSLKVYGLKLRNTSIFAISIYLSIHPSDYDVPVLASWLFNNFYNG